MKKLPGIIFAILSSTAFGFMPIFAKIAYNNGSNAMTLLFFRFLLAAIMLLVYFYIKKISLNINKKQLYIILLVGLLGYTSTGIVLFLSYNYISVGLATTMHFIYPAIVIVLNYLVYKEALTKNKVLALLISLIGVYVLIGINSNEINLKGAFLSLFSGFTFAGCVMGINHPELKKLDNSVQVFYFSVCAGTVFLMFSLLMGQLVLQFNIYTLSSYIGISFVSTIISIVLFIKAVKIIGASSASILGTFEPIVSIIMGIILFNEQLSFTIIVGTSLILTSIFILAGENQHTKTEV